MPKATSPLLALLLGLAVPSASAQDLARRIAGVRDGTVRLSLATRPGVCGDGRFIGEDTPEGFRMYVMEGQGFSITTLEDVQPDCRTGPLRLAVEKVGGAVRDLRTAVGVEWRAGGDATDLGTVGAAEAAGWLLDQAPRLAEEDDVRVALLAASMADSVRIAERLVGMTRDQKLEHHVREQAMRWLVGAAAREGLAARADQVLRAVASDQSEPLALRERAVRLLPATPANEAYLRDLYRQGGETALRERILRRLGESQTDATATWIRGVALDSGQPLALRERAIRVLGEEMKRPAEVRALYPRLDHPALRERALRVVSEQEGDAANAWLVGVASAAGEPQPVRERAIRLLAERGQFEDVRALYSRLDTQALRERVIRVSGEHGDSAALAWVESVAVDRTETTALRERAVRTLAERDVPTAALVLLYDRIEATPLRERLVRIFAERADQLARDKLAAIAEGDPDPALRRSAGRRLAEIKSGGRSL